MTRMGTSTPNPAENSAMHALDPAQREQAMSRIDELAMRAGRAERANKPTMLLLLAMLVLAGTFLFLLTSVSRLSEARGDLASRRSNAEQMAMLVAELKQMRDYSSEAATLVHESDPQIMSRISQVAASAGVQGLPLPTSLPDITAKDRPVKRVRFSYQISNPSLAPVMQFLSQVEQQIPGMRVYAIKITPDKERWSVGVTLSRLERVE